MAYLRVLGAPFAPAGKSLASATIEAGLFGEYADGTHRYARIHRGTYTAGDADARWKALGSVPNDGTYWYIPGNDGAEGSDDPPAPETWFMETQVYSDGTRQCRQWRQTVTGEADGTWLYPGEAGSGDGGGDGEMAVDTSPVLTAGVKTTAGTAAALGPARPIVEVLVQNPYSNADDVLVGSAAGQTILLRPGTDSGWIRIDDLSKVYVTADSGAPTVGYLARGD